ncbi:hypothetical protein EUTSA_v10009694mg [Eutrema salsugineum]|uniref:F-box associated beta-propeller type 3 domain-containing protein n=1 Tax=Eutrema salsugineum TaxID=72664 RepID=V4KQL0_EUTSA|nr:hypothetical protein EUTSA_v10009694mg [Eutrema salsugineum]
MPFKSKPKPKHINQTLIKSKPKSKYVYSLPNDIFVDCRYNISVVGATATGDILLSMRYPCRPFYVYYFNPESNTLKCVEIQSEGFGDAFCISNNNVYTFLDHVENLKFDIMKTIYDATSTSPLEEKRKSTSTSTSSKAHMQQDIGTFESINKFDALRLLNDD